MKTIAAADLASNRDQFEIIDVRTPGEYREVHIDHSHAMPLQDLDVARAKDLATGDKQICLVCLSGKRATMAAEKIEATGIEATVLDNGITGWQEANQPVIRGKGVMSIERQVRIAAGTLVVVGAILGTWVHPGFLALSGFVGAGLVFAGVTDTCGMGMLLAKMPWNR